MQPVDNEPALNNLGGFAQCPPLRADIGNFTLHYEVPVRQCEGDRPLVKADPRVYSQYVAHTFEEKGVVGHF
jgi:hypothetical protein